MILLWEPWHWQTRMGMEWSTGAGAPQSGRLRADAEGSRLAFFFLALQSGGLNRLVKCQLHGAIIYVTAEQVAVLYRLCREFTQHELTLSRDSHGDPSFL